MIRNMPRTNSKTFMRALPSIPGDAQGFDLLRQAVAVVGDDAFDGGEPVLDRAELGAQLGILARQQFDPLDRLVVLSGIDGLAPGAVERIAVLDAKPRREDPAAYRDHRDDTEQGKQLLDEVHRIAVHGSIPLRVSTGGQRSASISRAVRSAGSVAIRSSTRRRSSSRCTSRFSASFSSRSAGASA